MSVLYTSPFSARRRESKIPWNRGVKVSNKMESQFAYLTELIVAEEERKEEDRELQTKRISQGTYTLQDKTERDDGLKRERVATGGPSEEKPAKRPRVKQGIRMEDYLGESINNPEATSFFSNLLAFEESHKRLGRILEEVVMGKSVNGVVKTPVIAKVAQKIADMIKIKNRVTHLCGNLAIFRDQDAYNSAMTNAFDPNANYYTNRNEHYDEGLIYSKNEQLIIIELKNYYEAIEDMQKYNALNFLLDNAKRDRSKENIDRVLNVAGYKNIASMISQRDRHMSEYSKKVDKFMTKVNEWQSINITIINDEETTVSKFLEEHDKKINILYKWKELLEMCLKYKLIVEEEDEARWSSKLNEIEEIHAKLMVTPLIYDVNEYPKFIFESDYIFLSSEHVAVLKAKKKNMGENDFLNFCLNIELEGVRSTVYILNLDSEFKEVSLPKASDSIFQSEATNEESTTSGDGFVETSDDVDMLDISSPFTTSFNDNIGPKRSRGQNRQRARGVANDTSRDGREAFKIGNSRVSEEVQEEMTLNNYANSSVCGETNPNSIIEVQRPEGRSGDKNILPNPNETLEELFGSDSEDDQKEPSAGENRENNDVGDDGDDSAKSTTNEAPQAWDNKSISNRLAYDAAEVTRNENNGCTHSVHLSETVANFNGVLYETETRNAINVYLRKNDLEKDSKIPAEGVVEIRDAVKRKFDRLSQDLNEEILEEYFNNLLILPKDQQPSGPTPLDESRDISNKRSPVPKRSVDNTSEYELSAVYGSSDSEESIDEPTPDDEPIPIDGEADLATAATNVTMLKSMKAYFKNGSIRKAVGSVAMFAIVVGTIYTTYKVRNSNESFSVNLMKGYTMKDLGDFFNDSFVKFYGELSGDDVSYWMSDKGLSNDEAKAFVTGGVSATGNSLSSLQTRISQSNVGSNVNTAKSLVNEVNAALAIETLDKTEKFKEFVGHNNEALEKLSGWSSGLSGIKLKYLNGDYPTTDDMNFMKNACEGLKGIANTGNNSALVKNVIRDITSIENSINTSLVDANYLNYNTVVGINSESVKEQSKKVLESFYTFDGAMKWVGSIQTKGSIMKGFTSEQYNARFTRLFTAIGNCCEVLIHAPATGAVEIPLDFEKERDKNQEALDNDVGAEDFVKTAIQNAVLNSNISPGAEVKILNVSESLASSQQTMPDLIKNTLHSLVNDPNLFSPNTTLVMKMFLSYMTGKGMSFTLFFSDWLNTAWIQTIMFGVREVMALMFLVNNGIVKGLSALSGDINPSFGSFIGGIKEIFGYDVQKDVIEKTAGHSESKPEDAENLKIALDVTKKNESHFATLVRYTKEFVFNSKTLKEYENSFSSKFFSSWRDFATKLCGAELLGKHQGGTLRSITFMNYVWIKTIQIFKKAVIMWQTFVSFITLIMVFSIIYVIGNTIRKLWVSDGGKKKKSNFVVTVIGWIGVFVMGAMFGQHVWNKFTSNWFHYFSFSEAVVSEIDANNGSDGVTDIVLKGLASGTSMGIKDLSSGIANMFKRMWTLSNFQYAGMEASLSGLSLASMPKYSGLYAVGGLLASAGASFAIASNFGFLDKGVIKVFGRENDQAVNALHPIGKKEDGTTGVIIKTALDFTLDLWDFLKKLEKWWPFLYIMSHMLGFFLNADTTRNGLGTGAITLNLMNTVGFDVGMDSSGYFTEEAKKKILANPNYLSNLLGSNFGAGRMFLFASLSTGSLYSAYSYYRIKEQYEFTKLSPTAILSDGYETGKYGLATIELKNNTSMHKSWSNFKSCCALDSIAMVLWSLYDKLGVFDGLSNREISSVRTQLRAISNNPVPDKYQYYNYWMLYLKVFAYEGPNDESRDNFRQNMIEKFKIDDNVEKGGASLATWFSAFSLWSSKKEKKATYEDLRPIDISRGKKRKLVLPDFNIREVNRFTTTLLSDEYFVCSSNETNKYTENVSILPFIELKYSKLYEWGLLGGSSQTQVKEWLADIRKQPRISCDGSINSYYRNIQCNQMLCLYYSLKVVMNGKTFVEDPEDHRVGQTLDEEMNLVFNEIDGEYLNTQPKPYSVTCNLSAVIYRKNGNHFVCTFKYKNDWYFYDDLINVPVGSEMVNIAKIMKDSANLKPGEGKRYKPSVITNYKTSYHLEMAFYTVTKVN